MSDDYRVTVYYDGPKIAWSGKVHETETVFDLHCRWLWLARSLARRQMGNTGRCGYVITRAGAVVERFAATNSAYPAQ